MVFRYTHISCSAKELILFDTPSSTIVNMMYYIVMPVLLYFGKINNEI